MLLFFFFRFSFSARQIIFARQNYCTFSMFQSERPKQKKHSHDRLASPPLRPKAKANLLVRFAAKRKEQRPIYWSVLRQKVKSKREHFH